MQDFMTLGTTPVDEPCAQVGQPDYYDKVKGELVVDSSDCCARHLAMNRQERASPSRRSITISAVLRSGLSVRHRG